MSAYKLKEQPDDFIVIEESSFSLLDRGDHLIFEMKKVNYTTEDAIQQISKALGINRKSLGYAGTKDSRAVTYQKISLRGCSKETVESLKLKDINLRFLGFRNEPLHLGELDKNRFEITIRNINKLPKKIEKIVNLFGPQRFSVNNAEVGKCILKKDFKRAVELIMLGSNRDKEKMEAHLERNMNDYVGALKEIPWKNLQLYVHAYQSFIWNKAALEYSKNERSNESKLAIVGFSTYFLDDDEKRIYTSILEDENIILSDFVIRAIPDLTSEGGERPLYASLFDLKIGQLEEDELNPGMKKSKVAFSLGKGSYATTAIEEMMK